MEKKGDFFMIAIAIIIVLSTLGIVIWQTIKIMNEDKAGNQTNNIIEQETFNITANETINKISANKTEELNTEIPNPTGSVTFISRDGTGEYFCNKTVNPAHGVKVYTYRIINGTKRSSEKYIESKKIKVCDDYNNESVTNGVIYNIEWKWDAVEKIDGYKVYQYYYLNKNISINYNYGVDVKTNRILDTSLSLWKKN